MVQILIRFFGALAVILLTFNPTGYSYVHWLGDALRGPGMQAQHAFVGVVLLIGWTIMIRATFRSLGPFGLLLASALIGTFVWLLESYGLFESQSDSIVVWLALISLSALLAIGTSWSLVRRRITGQVDVDDVEDG